MQPLPGSQAMLEGLAAEGIYLGVVSNKTGELLRREGEWLGWSRLFGGIIGAGDAEFDKARAGAGIAGPGPGAASHPANRLWFVGDTAIDMECALNSGCVPILLGVFGDGGEFYPA